MRRFGEALFLLSLHPNWCFPGPVRTPLNGIPGSCTSTLRIIPMAHELGKMPPFHDHVRGQRHDLRRTFLHAALDRRGVVVLHTLLGVAICSYCLWPEASDACHATAHVL